jgi:hypothetical protein
VDSQAAGWLKRRHELAQRVALWINSGRAEAWLLDAAALARFERLLAEPSTEAPAPAAEWREFLATSQRRIWLRRLSEFEARRGLWERAGRSDSLLLDVFQVDEAQAWLDRRPADAPAPAPEVLDFIARSAEASRRRRAPAASVGRNSLVAPMLREEPPPPSFAGPAPRHEPSPVAPTRGALKASDMEAAWLRAGRASPAEPPAGDGGDLVDVSVFAPPQAKPAGSIMIQVMLHMTDDLDGAQARAALLDDAAVLRGNATLDILVPRGARTMVMLSEPALEIAQPVQTVVWRGRLGVANFIAKVAAGTEGDLFPAVHVAIDAAVVGEVRFKLAIQADVPAPGPNTLQPVSPKRYRRAFFSYSSRDRVKALEVAQCYRLAGVEFFQDVLNLDPGARWEQNLYREIDRCDLFLLFWSRAASESEWVAREAKYALERRDASADQRPELVPLILEGPPIARPPDFLAHLHFNDWMRLAIVAQPVRS